MTVWSASEVWGGWYFHYYTSSGGDVYWQRVHILAWGPPILVRPINKATSDAGEELAGLPIGRPAVVGLSSLYHETADRSTVR